MLILLASTAPLRAMYSAAYMLLFFDVARRLLFQLLSHTPLLMLILRYARCLCLRRYHASCYATLRRFTA